MIQDLFFNVLGNWQMLALAGIGVLMIYKILLKETYEQLWKAFPWNWKYALLGVAVILVIQIREIIGYPFSWIVEYFPTYSLAEQLFFYMGNIHIRSILFWAIMIFWLWKKMGSLLPAVLTGWFFIGLAELSFIPQHLIWQNGLFLGLQQYLPFILLMIPWILERKRFSVPWRAWIWFAAGVFMQYFGLIFDPWAVVKLQEGGWGFLVNPINYPHPHLLAYAFDLSQHLIKTFFTIAGAHTGLRIVIEKGSTVFKKERVSN